LIAEIYGKEQCPFCDMAKVLCTQKEIQFEYKQLGKDFTREEMIEKFQQQEHFPKLF